MAKILTLVLLAIFAIALGFDPDVYLNTSEAIISHGYLCEEHEIITEDGHILVVYRIPGKKNENPLTKKQPVYLQPGIFCTSDVFVAAGPKKGVAYFLANNGYDVWLVNSRGTFYSQKHLKYTRKDKEYWNYTFEELGVYDQRAVINYITKITGFPKVHFWSHSQGGTQMMAALTLDPEFYQKKLLSAVMTGPVYRFDLTTSIFIKIMNYTKLPHLSMQLGAYEFLPYNKLLSFSLLYLKKYIPPLYPIIVAIIADESVDITDNDKAEVFFAHFPAGASSKSFKHLIQLTEHPGFFRYRETSEDPIVYYDFSKVPNVPLAVFAGQADLLSTPAEIAWLQEQFFKVGKKVYVKTYKNIGHIPFLSPLDSNQGFLKDGLEFFSAAETDNEFKETLLRHNVNQ